MSNDQLSINPTYNKLKTLAEKFPEDEFLQCLLETYRPYPPTDQSDDDLLYAALKEKYNL
ncbi:hypothetical protein [Marinilabilia salmonicolor]|uniref:hypothetical protein n=1 Tax=Marinilabilia salmonicolor TaxID=989 RepID=UPI000306B939|nr:hypothetical protein [Marinilabilia salmonicolor]